MRLDSELALFLLDSYEKDLTMSTPRKHILPPPPVSSIGVGSLSDREEDFSEEGIQSLAVDTVEDEIQQLEESVTSMSISDGSINEGKFNSIQNSWSVLTGQMRPGTLKRILMKLLSHWRTWWMKTALMMTTAPLSVCVYRAGGSVKTPVCIEELPLISIEDSVHDNIDGRGSPTCDIRPAALPEKHQVLCPDDIIGQHASIVYDDCLKKLAKFLVLPVRQCTAKDPRTLVECQALPPFEVRIVSRGTAVVMEWICTNGHSLWKWNSQPTLKFGMQAGDFMMATNILLSGNNYTKVALLFKFMNMGMVERSSFFKIQDTYCVDTIKDFWNEKRKEIITRLKSRDNVVALADGRMDSPGHCAQYCTYTTMENETKGIISIVTIDKRETQGNSVIMEKVAFVRTFDQLLQEVKLTEICTDAHMQISALFNTERGKYKDARHCKFKSILSNTTRPSYSFFL